MVEDNSWGRDYKIYSLSGVNPKFFIQSYCRAFVHVNWQNSLISGRLLASPRDEDQDNFSVTGLDGKVIASVPYDGINEIEIYQRVGVPSS